MVFQGPSLLPALDVTENVALPLLFAGQSEDQAMQHAAITLTLLQIGELADKLPDELSGGQAQRAAIARVLAARPKLILADEPPANSTTTPHPGPSPYSSTLPTRSMQP